MQLSNLHMFWYQHFHRAHKVIRKKVFFACISSPKAQKTFTQVSILTWSKFYNSFYLWTKYFIQVLLPCLVNRALFFNKIPCSVKTCCKQPIFFVQPPMQHTQTEIQGTKWTSNMKHIIRHTLKCFSLTDAPCCTFACRLSCRHISIRTVHNMR